MADTETILRESPLFAGVDHRTIHRVVEQATRRTYKAGDTIVRQGDAASALYLVLSGRVSISREMDGKESKLVEQGPGTFFGEMALIEDHPRTASVTAIEPTQCLLVVAWEFTALMHAHPSVVEALFRELVTRTHRQEHHVF